MDDLSDVQQLSPQQRAVLRLIRRISDVAGEAPSVRLLARRMGVDDSTVQGHLNAAFKKGWLRAPVPDAVRIWPAE